MKFIREKKLPWEWLLVLAAVLTGTTLLLMAMWSNDMTYDEGNHLNFSYQLVEEFDAGRGEPAFISTTPVVVLNVLAAKAAEDLKIESYKTRVLLTRLPNLIWYLGLVFLSMRLMTRLVPDSRWAPAAAGSIVALEPNLIAHLSVVTVDGTFAFATLLLLFAIVRYRENPGWLTAGLIGVAAGFAICVKFSAILLYPVLGALPFLIPNQKKPAFKTWLFHGAMALVAWCVVVNTMFLFINVGTPLSQTNFESSYFQSLASNGPWLRLPVPISLLEGIDLVLHQERGRSWNVYLLGKFFPSGVWYYFLVLWLFKTPLACIGMTAIGSYQMLKHNVIPGGKTGWLLLGTIAWFLFYFSFMFRTQVGYRYVLMCIPLVTLLTLAGLWMSNPLSRRPALWSILIVIAVGGATIAYAGNPLSFTNLWLQPKESAYKIMADSNLSWGQNRSMIHQWMAEHEGGEALNPDHIRPGINVIELNRLTGVFSGVEKYRWVRENLEPYRHVGHTYLIYDVTQTQYQTYLKETRTSPAQ